MNKNILFVTFIIVVFACNRETELNFSDFDKDDDQQISKEEFSDVFTANFYDDWNSDNDEYLDDEDFVKGSFDMWDKDDNNFLTQDEYIFAYDYYKGHFLMRNFADIDVNTDERVNLDEYSGHLTDTDYYGAWDVDANEIISEEELAAGVFSVWDKDNNGYLDKNEYQQFDSEYSDI